MDPSDAKRRSTRCAAVVATVLLWLLVAILPGGLAANPSLVKDVNDTPIQYERSVCGKPVSVGPTAYFCGSSEGNFQPGILWRSDGTEAGTRPLLDADGNRFSYPRQLVVSNGLLYFRARVRGYRLDVLWVTDGTPHGTFPLRDAAGNPFGTDIDLSLPIDGGLYLFAGYSELWKTDGSVIWRVASFPGTSIQGATMVGRTLYFIDYDHRLWKSDGTTAGTAVVIDLPYRATRDWTRSANVDGTLFFTLQSDDYNVDLWKSDGTAAGTVMVKKSPVGRSWGVEGLTAVDGLLYFVGDGVDYRNLEFWVSDGTEAGTRRIKVIPDSPTIDSALAFDGRYVVGTRSALWISDGSEAGTFPVFSGLVNSWSNLVEYGGLILFAADDLAGLGVELWATDGTSAGTRMVRDIGWGEKSSSPHYLTLIDTGVLFQANKGEHLGGDSLWITDATRLGTQLVADLTQNTQDAHPLRMTRVGDEVYFLANMTIRPNLYQQWELWKTDASEAGTTPVVNLIEERTVTRAAFGDEYGDLIAFDGQLYFVGRDDTGWQLWRTDGTALGTHAIHVPLGEPALDITELTVYRGRLYFFVETGGGSGLWQLAPGAPEAAPVRTNLSRPTGMVVFGDALYFANNANEIWRSDGRSAGTEPVVSVTRGDQTSVVELVDVNDSLFAFRVLWDQEWLPENYGNRSALWVSDGTAAGTYEVTAPYPSAWNSLIAGGAIWFEAGGGLWIHDGSSRQPTFLTDESAEWLTLVGDQVYFSKGEFGELWVSDGTPAGTRVVVDRVQIFSPIAGLDGRVYFSAYDRIDDEPLSGYDGESMALRVVRESGVGADIVKPGLRLFVALGDDPKHSFIGELDEGPGQFWVTDGTEDGTRAVTNFFDMRVYPDRIQLGDTLLMSLDADRHGVELWRYALDAQDAPPIACGQPARIQDGMPRLYAWNWCNSDRWVVELLQDSSTEARFSGSVFTTAGALGGLNLQQLEPHDSVSLDATGVRIDFRLRLWSGTDRFAFTAPSDGMLCLSLDGPDDAAVFVGPEAQPVGSGVDLRTGKVCWP